MSKKIIVTPRKNPQLLEGSSTDEVHAPTFNILTQILPPKNIETPAKGGSSHLKDQKEKKNEAKKRNEDGTISESEVTGTVASKFGGAHIAKEHAPDTSNYPTPRPRKINLRLLIAPSTF
ncbi:hypothetical protein H5410_056620 [Solanum commersonii]|uniref:Uncharacterized protein n=1 Tax=Solanum commersonii TaxID=4109 RepID=A0A9J5WNL4_SOLCO|nr:hypothetical protein H5410_056620 [Solanum commersonii]